MRGLSTREIQISQHSHQSGESPWILYRGNDREQICKLHGSWEPPAQNCVRLPIPRLADQQRTVIVTARHGRRRCGRRYAPSQLVSQGSNAGKPALLQWKRVRTVPDLFRGLGIGPDHVRQPRSARAHRRRHVGGCFQDVLKSRTAGDFHRDPCFQQYCRSPLLRAGSPASVRRRPSANVSAFPGCCPSTD